MDGMTFLQRADAAGLEVAIDGEQLRVCGPRQAEPLALDLIRHKAEVVAALGTYSPVERRPIR